MRTAVLALFLAVGCTSIPSAPQHCETEVGPSGPIEWPRCPSRYEDAPEGAGDGLWMAGCEEPVFLGESGSLESGGCRLVLEPQSNCVDGVPVCPNGNQPRCYWIEPAMNYCG